MLFLKQKVKTVSHDFFLHDNVTKTEEFVKRLKTQSRPSADRNTTDVFFRKATAKFVEQSSLTRQANWATVQDFPCLIHEFTTRNWAKITTNTNIQFLKHLVPAAVFSCNSPSRIRNCDFTAQTCE
jgi:hypothetical protein